MNRLPLPGAYSVPAAVLDHAGRLTRSAAAALLAQPVIQHGIEGSKGARRSATTPAQLTQPCSTAAVPATAAVKAFDDTRHDNKGKGAPATATLPQAAVPSDGAAELLQSGAGPSKASGRGCAATAVTAAQLCQVNLCESALAAPAERRSKKGAPQASSSTQKTDRPDSLELTRSQREASTSPSGESAMSFPARGGYCLVSLPRSAHGTAATLHPLSTPPAARAHCWRQVWTDSRLSKLTADASPGCAIAVEWSRRGDPSGSGSGYETRAGEWRPHMHMRGVRCGNLRSTRPFVPDGGGDSRV